MKRKIILIVKLIIGIGLLALVIRTVDFKQLSYRISSINYFLLFIVWLLFTFDRILMALKWNLLLKWFGVFLSLWQSVKIYYVGTLLGTFTPGSIGGDAYRIMALANFNKSKIIASTVILERIIGYFVLAAFAGVLLPFSARIFKIHIMTHLGMTISFIFMLAAIFLLLFFPLESCKLLLKIKALHRFELIKKMNGSLAIYLQNPMITRKKIFYFVLLTALEVVVIIYMNYVASLALHIKVSFLYYLVTLPILYILIRLPITIEGIGLQEGLWVYVLTLAGFSAADGISLSFLLRVMEIFSVFLPASIILLFGSLKAKTTT